MITGATPILRETSKWWICSQWQMFRPRISACQVGDLHQLRGKAVPVKEVWEDETTGAAPGEWRNSAWNAFQQLEVSTRKGPTTDTSLFPPLQLEWFRFTTKQQFEPNQPNQQKAQLFRPFFRHGDPSKKHRQVVFTGLTVKQLWTRKRHRRVAPARGILWHPFVHCPQLHFGIWWRRPWLFKGVYSVTQYGSVSWNRGTPKSSILIGCSLRNHPCWDTPILGNPHMNLILPGFFRLLMFLGEIEAHFMCGHLYFDRAGSTGFCGRRPRRMRSWGECPLGDGVTFQAYGRH